MTNRVRYALALVCASAMASSASAVTIFDLLTPGETITSGDKVFSNFTWTSGAVDPADVTVNPFSQVVSGGLEYGLEFVTPTLFTTGFGSSVEATMNYTVTPNVPGRLISDNTLTMDSTVGSSLGGNATILENATQTGTGLLLAAKANFDNGSSSPILFEHVEYPIAVVSADVNTLITLNGGALGDPRIHKFAQTFSQIPEPATMGLALMGGLFGTAVFLRRRWG